MTIDKFGHNQRAPFKIQQQRNVPIIGFQLSVDGDYDIQHKQLINLKDPINSNDTTTKKYVDESIKNLKKYTDNLTSNLKEDILQELRNEISRVYGIYDNLKLDLDKEILKSEEKTKDHIDNQIKLLIKFVNSTQNDLKNVESYVLRLLEHVKPKPNMVF